MQTTDDELIAWAYEVDADDPEQDWDLIVADSERADLLLQLASDAACPKREYFFSLLRRIVDDCFRTLGAAGELNDTLVLLRRAQRSDDAELATWAHTELERSASVLLRRLERRERNLREIRGAQQWIEALASGRDAEFYVRCLYRLLEDLRHQPPGTVEIAEWRWLVELAERRSNTHLSHWIEDAKQLR